MDLRSYSFILVKAYEARGYRWKTKPLPKYMHITIEEDCGSKWLCVRSTIHANPVVQVGPTHSKEFSDLEMIKGLSDDIARRYSLS
jgi:hypothetical protein